MLCFGYKRKIESNDDFDKIKKESEKIEIDNIKNNLDTKEILEKLTKIGFSNLSFYH